MHSSGSPGAPLTLNRFFMELHNLQQRGEIQFKEETQPEGPAHDRTWRCFITINFIRLPYSQEPLGQTFWHSADQKQAARDEAARQVLKNIGFNDTVH
ncbi:hypothetical protein FRC01_005311 [Tulasnella sp. 417]|nr:hypothetical protein FRC01_005311 [Tulasnella sp. 417]